MKKLLPLLILLTLVQVGLAQAAFLENNNFLDRGSEAPVTNVEGLLFECKDIQECRKVKSGTVFSGNSGNSNKLTVVYPATSSRVYYGEYFFQQCRLPLGFLAFSSGSGEITYDTHFEQATDCRSPVDLQVTNTAFVNEPVQIGIDAALDTRSTSAFRENKVPPIFIPPNHANDFSAETNLRVTVKNAAGTIVFDDTVNLNLLMDTSVVNNFLWMPTTPGTYTVKARTKVTDCQCSNNLPQSSSKVIQVLPARPLNQCYTILNDLTTDNQFPTEGERVFYTVDKISNFMDGAGVITPLKTQLNIKVVKSGAVVEEKNLILPANPDGNTREVSFDVTYAGRGQHSVQLTGVADQCPAGASANIVDVINKDVFVAEPPLFDLFFTIFDIDTGNRIQGATVSINNGRSGVTGVNGNLTLTDFPSAQYTYTITHPNFQTLSDDFTVALTDVTFDLQMKKVNSVPSIITIPDQTVRVGVPIVLDLDDFANDIDDPQSALTFTAGHDSSVSSSIDSVSHVITITAASDAQATVSITVTDPKGAAASTSFVVMFVSCMGDSDCPADGIQGNSFCSVGGDVVNIFRDHSCQNPASMQSVCVFTDITQVLDDCTGAEVCENAACQTPVCSVETQCGTDGLLGSLFCSGSGDVTDTFRDFSCNAGGTANASCSFVDTATLITDCTASQVCENAACVNVVCFNEAACGTDGFLGSPVCNVAGNVSDTFRDFTCNNAGTANSSCSSSDSVQQSAVCGIGTACENGVCGAVACSVETQCGADGFLGSPICDASGNVSDTFRDFTCNGAGTVNSTCSSVDSVQTSSVCGSGQVCENAACQNVACSTNAQCGTNAFLGNTFCDASGNVSDTFRTFTCNSAGTANSTCSSLDSIQTVTTCGSGQTCENAACQNVACSTNAQCNGATPVGTFFCQGRNRVQTSRSFACISPGLTNSTCLASDTTLFIETCANGCTDGVCNNKPKDGLKINHIRIVSGGALRGDDLFQTVITMSNDGDTNLRRIQLSAFNPTAGTMARSRHFDLGKGDRVARKLFLQMPDAEPGLHTIRFTISNDKVRRVVHRDILIE